MAPEPLQSIEFPESSQPQSSARSPGSASSSALNGTATSSGLRPGKDGSPSAADEQNKKPKLSFAEKQAKRTERELKDRQKTEDKVKREEEKARKEGERRVKDAAREEKRKAKEEHYKLKQAEKDRKEEERHRKEDEKNKKARVGGSTIAKDPGLSMLTITQSQLRMDAFFHQPSMPNGGSNGSPTRDGHSPLSSRRSSITEINAMEAPRRSQSVLSSPQKPKLPDYQRCFPEFFVKPNMIVAPANRFSGDEEGLSYAQSHIDESLNHDAKKGPGPELNASFTPHDLLHISPHKRRRRPYQAPTVKAIVAQIYGTARFPIDLTDSQLKKGSQKPPDLLKSIPVKYLKFAEDVRPPYIGTYTRLSDHYAISKLSRKPFRRALPETNYDYDSEVEWEEPVEGEDLDSEGEEELGDDEDGDEMEGFLDDEEAIDAARAVKRRPVVGDLEPSCTGLCWQGPQEQLSSFGEIAVDMCGFKLDILMGERLKPYLVNKADHAENPKFPIDPYSTSYWQPNTSTIPILTSKNNPMDPPRIPLNPINLQNNLLSPPNTGLKNPNPDTSTLMKPLNSPKRLIASELMDEFKVVVQGNDLTKVGLLEILKRQFPKQSKDAIRGTLDMIAERVGPKQAEKKWVLREGF
ncbi:hypothetical protein MMC28_006944 [Mycoblastus sanguinarius]|nr:hypothetical protein [Mycoblastus sanguinarius]